MTYPFYRDASMLVVHAGFLMLALLIFWSTGLAQSLGQGDFAAGNRGAYQDHVFDNSPDWRPTPETGQSWRADDPVWTELGGRMQIDDPTIFDEMARGEAQNARGDQFRAVDPAPAMRLRLRF